LDCYNYFKEEIDDGSIVYLFGTDGGIFYQVAFDINLYSNHLDRFPYLLEHGYGLGIYPSEGDAKPSRKTSDTIKTILADFFIPKIRQHFYYIIANTMTVNKRLVIGYLRNGTTNQKKKKKRINIV
jgi:hypothetical protein